MYISHLGLQVTPWCRFNLETRNSQVYYRFHGTPLPVPSMGCTPRPCVTFRYLTVFLRFEVVRSQSIPQHTGLPLLDCPPLLIQHIRSYFCSLDAVSTISGLNHFQCVPKIIFFSVTDAKNRIAVRHSSFRCCFYIPFSSITFEGETRNYTHSRGQSSCPGQFVSDL